MPAFTRKTDIRSDDLSIASAYSTVRLAGRALTSAIHKTNSIREIRYGFLCRRSTHPLPLFRATSKALTPRLLAARWAWARVKGISVVATGDFTHPGWLQELKDQLVPDGSGLCFVWPNH